MMTWVRALVCLLVCCSVAMGSAWARPSPWSDDSFLYNPKIWECNSLIEPQGKYVKAREMAEEIFQAAPESFQSWYIMGKVLWRCEGNLPRAWFYFSGARERLERQYGHRVGDHVELDEHRGPVRLHTRMMLEMSEVLGQMEAYEEEIELLETYDRVYDPRQTARYAWPLMKLGRYDEAKAKIEQALRDEPNDEYNVTYALNSLGAVEGELEHVEKSYEVFLKLIETVRRNGWRLEATYFYNAAEQAMELHRFAEQEQHLTEATRHFDPHSYTNPWTALAQYYVNAGRLTEALSAVREMHDWSHRSEPSLEQQHWSETQQVTAQALLVAGFDQDALGLMRRTLNRPDRRGGNSMQQDQTEISTLVLYHEMLKTEAERYNERLAWCTWGDWFKLQSARVENQRARWSTTSRGAAVIISHDRLQWALRPYPIDSRIQEWYRGSLYQFIGEGVLSVECRKLLERADSAGEREKPYHLALVGEADAARGHRTAAIEELEQARKTLPAAEVLLRARITALLAWCYEREGDSAQSMNAWRQVMERAPHMMRQLGMALPVTIESDGSPAASYAAGWMHHSPRFNDVGQGFTVRVSDSGGGATAVLVAPDGATFCSVSVKDQGDPKSTARALCQDFHNQAFAPRLDLSQTDINSLDGSNQTADTNREELIRILGVPGASPSPSPAPE